MQRKNFEPFFLVGFPLPLQEKKPHRNRTENHRTPGPNLKLKPIFEQGSNWSAVLKMLNFVFPSTVGENGFKTNKPILGVKKSNKVVATEARCVVEERFPV